VKGAALISLEWINGRREVKGKKEARLQISLQSVEAMGRGAPRINGDKGRL